ncbi:MAG TPA: M20/M25/M40 family metallo-hydrolase [Anaerolineales bacterium]|nr:M20/M25/M40 family metallo-hydrolase [Anaerolineales bacterium]
MQSLPQFVEKYQLALETALKEKPQSGLCGFELEWNLLDEQFHPLLTVGTGPDRRSFVDYLRADCLPGWAHKFNQLEVFHWMIEWVTRAYYSPRLAVYEGRLMEALLLNSLDQAGRAFGEHLYAWHGNLLYPVDVGGDVIPGGWHLAKRRYLQRCVELYGPALATAGIHTNLSLPDPLFAWDFVHLPSSDRDEAHLDSYKSEFYVTATRLSRAFAALFIATAASTPLRADSGPKGPRTVLTENDSVRNLTFPNPAEIDRPDLYRSYADYLRISYDLVRRGVRFGNNNWTPVRARSFAEPVERLIAVTSEQLHEIYNRGLYSIDESQTADETAHQIEMQNLRARIDLPMARIEIRTDDGGQPLEIDVANLTLKHLLLLRFYADPKFARSFRYDKEDVGRARNNEQQAAGLGLRAEIENPFSGKPVGMREFLGWTLEQVRPLAEPLGMWDDLQPLAAMAAGEPNTSERLRARIRAELGKKAAEVPVEFLRTLAEERQSQVRHDLEQVLQDLPRFGSDSIRLGEALQHAREDARRDPSLPIAFRPGVEIHQTYADKTAEVVDLAQQLIRIPSVTTGPDERLEEVRRAAALVFDTLREHGFEARYFEGKYPSVLATFPHEKKPDGGALLSGHFDVVPPEPDDSQFEPRIEGDYLWGRGAADMKTVVATYMVWMKDRLHQGPPYPPVSLLLVGNEENGETEPMGTPQVLKILADEGYVPGLLAAGERTGEAGTELTGEVCPQNRGILRFEVIGRGVRAHSGVAGAGPGLTARLLAARTDVEAILNKRLTLASPDGWKSQVTFPYIQVGTPGIYNVTADLGRFGVEVRPIPQDDVSALQAELAGYCAAHELELSLPVKENGIACDPANPYLTALLKAVGQVSCGEPRVGRKLPATSARFAPGGQGVVWGQTGIGPHSKDERHFLPSILPYYNILQAWGEELLE